MNDLSMLQKRVLTFVKAFLNNYGYSPSVRDIAKGFDIKSTSTVHTALNVLEQKGYITRDGGQSRSTVLTGVKLESGVYSIPLRISEEKGDSFGVIDIPKSLVQDREGVFAVKAPFGF
ncbi:MAG: helix-turn-helix domain-containing protein, partial [Clostridia bacterium]|nr:helix-turn-helix domain-containing protein [Clostridia bacterium]